MLVSIQELILALKNTEAVEALVAEDLIEVLAAEEVLVVVDHLAVAIEVSAVEVLVADRKEVKEAKAEALHQEVLLVAKLDHREVQKEVRLEALLVEPLIKVLAKEVLIEVKLEAQAKAHLLEDQALVLNQQELQARDLKDLQLKVLMVQKNSVLKKSSKLFLECLS